MSIIQRRFDRMFPGITTKNSKFDKTLLAEGRTTAEYERNISQQQDTSKELGGVLLGTFIYNFEKGEEIFIPANKK